MIRWRAIAWCIALWGHSLGAAWCFESVHSAYGLAMAVLAIVIVALGPFVAMEQQ